jgi:hypothetical protein
MATVKNKEVETDVVADDQTAIATQADNQVQRAQSQALSNGSGNIGNQLDFQRALSAVSEGFDDFYKVEDLVQNQRLFTILDAYTITDFEDKSTGEVSDKFVFKLAFEDSGETVKIMQASSGVRKQIVALFERGRLEGISVELRHYRMTTKSTGQIQPAKIFDDSLREVWVNGKRMA